MAINAAGLTFCLRVLGAATVLVSLFQRTQTSPLAAQSARHAA